MVYLTRQERYVLLFLIVGAIIGIGYSYYKRYHPPLMSLSPSYRQTEVFSASDLDRMLKKEKTVNINTATERDLTRLKGIGSVLAQRIVAYRDAHGPFLSADDLTAISGIGPKKLEAIREYVVLE